MYVAPPRELEGSEAGCLYSEYNVRGCRPQGHRQQVENVKSNRQESERSHDEGGMRKWAKTKTQNERKRDARKGRNAT